MARNIPKQLQNGLVLWLDGNGKDLSGGGNNGTITNGPLKVRRLQNDGLTYPNSNSYTLIANESNFDFERTDSFTISMWYKFNAIGTERILMGKMVNGGNYTGISFGFISTNVAVLQLISTLTTNHLEVKTTGTLTDTTKYYMVSVAYTGTSAPSGVSFYFDGVLQTNATVTNNLSASILNNIQVEIGNRWSGAGSSANGNIINPMIWNRALSATEIDLLHKSTFIK